MPTKSAAKRRGRPTGTTTRRIRITFRSTGESTVYKGYEEAAARLGLRGDSLRVYLAHSPTREITREVWSDDIGAYDLATITRIGVDPLNHRAE